ncbi:DUF418 domain-containing protein [Bacillus sp. T3]|uniref:DUF418 domain-containing protein n=1 Tax=Bacillus sp. T3 TaxID=467262 RepID=UPI002980FBF8|nr:DUF418 domain-containing protein [Bacillus sp. T3]
MAWNSDVEIRNERILSIDIIRGFSILGIFLVNMMSFHSPLLYLDPLQWWDHPIDRITYILIDIFAQASFYPLFSMLFGYSMVLLLEKVQLRGQHFYRILVRRLLALLLFGIVHAFFIWHGDILIQYALLGFVLLPFLKLSGRSLFIAGISFYTVPVLLITMVLFFTSTVSPSLYDGEAVAQSIAIYQQGSFLDVTQQRAIDWMETNNLENGPFLFISIFPLFLIGVGMAKLKWIQHHKVYRKRLLCMLISTLVLGLSLKELPYLVDGALYAEYVQDSVGGVSLAFFYGALLILVSEKTKWLNSLALIGKMSISHYLFQSLVSSMIFYGYGFGLYGKVSLFSGTILVFVIFSLQIVLSRIWLKYFTFGPVEWLWRTVTYWKKVKLRKRVD